MASLVTGGASYIGSHMALALIEACEKVVLLDDLSTGFKCDNSRLAMSIKLNNYPRIIPFITGTPGIPPGDFILKRIAAHFELLWQSKPSRVISSRPEADA